MAITIYQYTDLKPIQKSEKAARIKRFKAAGERRKKKDKAAKADRFSESREQRTQKKITNRSGQKPKS